MLQCCWEEYRAKVWELLLWIPPVLYCHYELHHVLMCKMILCVKPGFFIAISVIPFHFIWLFLFYYPPVNAELKLFGAFKFPHSQFICCLYSQFSYLAQLQSYILQMHDCSTETDKIMQAVGFVMLCVCQPSHLQFHWIFSLFLTKPDCLETECGLNQKDIASHTSSSIHLCR